MRSLTMLLCGCVIAAALQGQVRVINVPADINSIQAAIDIANPGDTVLVDTGTYYEQINFLGKAITVASKYLTTSEQWYIDNTIIDGEYIQYSDPDSCSLVYFINDEDTTSVLCGFTIQHGKGTHIYESYTSWSGGGIFISNAGAKLVYNHITENHLSDTITGGSTQLALGAGLVEFGNENIDNWLIIDHNRIDHNTLYSSNLQAVGSGLLIVNTNAVISNNLISGNTSRATGNSSAVAAGFLLQSSNDSMMIARIESNVIKDNLSRGEGNAWSSTSAAYIEFISCSLTGNLIEQNTNDADHNFYTTGGVIAIYSPKPGTFIRNNTFKNNVTDDEGGGLTIWHFYSQPDQETMTVENNYFLHNTGKYGGGLYVCNVPVLLQNNIFNGNVAELHGGAAFFKKDHPLNNPHLATLINCTFSANVAGNYGGAIFSTYGDPLIINSIFWNDSCNQLGDEIFLQVHDSAEIAFTNIDTEKIEGAGVWSAGIGNINEDPLFDDPDSLTILPESPCFDAGINVFTCACGVTNFCPSYDINGIGRPQSGGFEIGAFELIFVDIPAQEENRFEASIYPNPFSNKTTINYTLEKNAFVSISVLNGFGQMVAMPVNGWQQGGEHRYIFNAEGLSSGIYFYRIEAGKQEMSGKMVLLKP